MAHWQHWRGDFLWAWNFCCFLDGFESRGRIPSVRWPLNWYCPLCCDPGWGQLLDDVIILLTKILQKSHNLEKQHSPFKVETPVGYLWQALGGISGGNFNPAVSVALGCVNSMKGPGMDWKQVGAYCVVQAGGFGELEKYDLLYWIEASDALDSPCSTNYLYFIFLFKFGMNYCIQ